jgi:hypothetical protein
MVLLILSLATTLFPCIPLRSHRAPENAEVSVRLDPSPFRGSTSYSEPRNGVTNRAARQHALIAWLTITEGTPSDREHEKPPRH